MAKKKKKATSVKNRPPVVAILGHVDHGKTTLLDHIRKTHVQEKEAGGITQSIGAYQVEFQGKKITFIDTPGHAAFSKMRSQGADVADISILVVAADDGVKPQTIESISHIKEAKTPLIVAINKIDAPGASIETAKAQLTEHEVFVEGYGGNTPVVEVSAKKGENINELLENILILTELEELPYEPETGLEALIIEAQKDTKKGVLVSAIIQKGTLKIQNNIKTESASGRVRALYDENGKSKEQINPGEPVQILGFKNLPKVGEIITSIKKGVQHDFLIEKPQNIPAVFEENEDELNIILKADTLGSLEAIRGNLTDEINIIHAETGNITESDILLASTTSSIILGFNSKATGSIKKLAEIEGVVIKSYTIIYELLEYLEKRILSILEPTIDEDVLGEARVLKIFDFGDILIAGSQVNSGKISIGDTIHLKRNDKIIKDSRVKSLKTGKEDVNVVKSGNECGILLSPQLDIKKKDIIISYNKKKEES